MREQIDYVMPRLAGERILGLMAEAQRNPELAALLHAVHQVVAGGRVEVRIARSGEAAAVAELDALVTQGLRLSNEVNAAAGAYVCMAG